MIARCTFLLLFFIAPPILGQAQVENLGVLAGTVSETSGLLHYNGNIITHNDSGNAAFLFEIDTVSLAVTRTVTVINATNVDWEDLAQDENYIYIGDFGNNLGQRTDLAIYRVAKSDYQSSDSVVAERIDFSYEDQIDFDGNTNSDWDAEAFIVLDNQLVLFTKQWQSNGTVAYSIPKTPGTHTAVNLGSYAVNGLITGGTYNEISGVLFLVGYSQQLQPFLLRMEDLTDVFSFNSTTEKMSLDIGFAQVEGICYTDENTYYISSERFTNDSPPVTLDARLFRFNTEDSPEGEENPEEPTPTDPPATEEGSPELLLYVPPNSKVLHYVLNVETEVFGRAIFDVAGRRIHNSHANDIETNSIDLSVHGTAVYYLTFYLQGRTIAKPFILR